MHIPIENPDLPDTGIKSPHLVIGPLHHTHFLFHGNRLQRFLHERRKASIRRRRKGGIPTMGSGFLPFVLLYCTAYQMG
jgi:hypothetical protein